MYKVVPAATNAASKRFTNKKEAVSFFKTCRNTDWVSSKIYEWDPNGIHFRWDGFPESERKCTVKDGEWVDITHTV